MVAMAACMPASGSQAPREQYRRAVGESGDPRHPGDALHGLGEAGPIPPWAGEAEGRHAHHHESRVDGVQPLPPEAELFHHPRGVVLNEDIGGRSQPLEQARALGPGQVERDSLAWTCSRRGTVVPTPTTGRLWEAGWLPMRIRSGRLTDSTLITSAPRRRQHVGRRRSRPPGGAVDRRGCPASGRCESVGRTVVSSGRDRPVQRRRCPAPRAGAARQRRFAGLRSGKGAGAGESRPLGAGRNTLRGSNCSNSAIVDPLSTGPAGMR